MTRKELDRRYSDIVEFAGIERFIDTPVRNYSNGMIVRLGFAIAAHVDPEILLIDEILSVGDQTFQRKSAEKIEEFKRDGRTIVIVSHGLSSVQQLCENVAWLDHGILRAVGPAASVIAEYTGDTYEVQEASETTIGKRWGSGRVSISTIELLNKENRPSEVFDNGAPLTIRVSYSSHAPINDLVVSIRISTLSGIDVWKGTSLNNGLAISKSLGSGMISMTIPQLPLLEGCYLVSVALTNPSESTEFDHWQDCYKFDVHQVDNLDEGIVAFPTTWRTE
jgi:ABC-2 type transport system ATP-binding protein